MNKNTNELGIKEVRFYAVTGAKTKNNGIIIGTSSLTSTAKIPSCKTTLLSILMAPQPSSCQTPLRE